MKKRIKNEELRIKNLKIDVNGSEVCLRFNNVETRMDLKKNPILLGINKAVGDRREISGIEVHFDNASFSITRQVVVAVNTLAWQLGIKINGKKQIQAKYSAEPNIT